MRVAFFCWGAGLLALLVTIWPSLRFLSGTLSRAWLILIVVALFGAGIFKTDPITDLTRSLANTLHTIFGALTILTFPFAATVTIHSLLEHTIWQSVQAWLIFGTILVWIGLVAYFASIIISAAGSFRREGRAENLPGLAKPVYGGDLRYLVNACRECVTVILGIIPSFSHQSVLPKNKKIANPIKTGFLSVSSYSLLRLPAGRNSIRPASTRMMAPIQ